MLLVLQKLLKLVFPIPFLKRSFLVYNKVRIKTVDKILFPEYTLSKNDFVIQKDEYPFRLITVRKSHLDLRLKKQFQENDNWTQDEYLLVFRNDVIIEPSQGWGITGFNELVYPSLGFSRAPYVPKPTLGSLFKRDNLATYPELISFRDTGEENYFHFYNDILPKLFFLEEHLGLAASVPILISSRLYYKPFFQYFLKHPYLGSRNWIIQDTAPVKSKLTYFCKPLTHTKKYYDKILEFVPDFSGEAGPERRIFITRSPKRFRFIENIEEVEDLVRKFHFEVIDFDELTIEEQIKLFSQTRYAIGIHGAGLTNMIFRRGRPMSLLEIFPPGNYFPFHYVLLATQYGYNYDGIIGDPSLKKFSGGFLLDVKQLETRLKAMLDSGSNL